METIIAIGVMGMLATGTAGLPSRDEREWIDHTKRVCASVGDTDPNHTARQCILADMERRKRALLADIQSGAWRSKR